MSRSVLPVYESIQSWNKEMQSFYSSLNDLIGVLTSIRYQDTVLSDYWIYNKFAERNKLQVIAADDSSLVMDASQAHLSQAIMEHYGFSVLEHIIDFEWRSI